MRRCPECKIEVGDPVSRCPLCGAELESSGTEQTEVPLYPVFSAYDQPRSAFPLLAKIFAFISLIAAGTCTLINLLTSFSI